MRMWFLVLPLAALLTVACADSTESEAASEYDGTLLIERMTRDRTPASTTPSTLHLESETGPIVPVKRVPLSTMHVEVGSKPPAVQDDSPASLVISPNSAEEVDPLVLLPRSEAGASSRAKDPRPNPPVEAEKKLQPAKVIRPNQIASSAFPAASRQENRSAKPQPPFANVPDIQFDPIHGEHILKLPNTDDDGFVGMPGSRRDMASQQSPQSGQHHRENQATNQQPRPQQRVLPKLFRRGR